MTVAWKVEATAVRHGLIPLIRIGETLVQRAEGGRAGRAGNPSAWRLGKLSDAEVSPMNRKFKGLPCQGYFRYIGLCRCAAG
jgi:hypothetical protein